MNEKITYQPPLYAPGEGPNRASARVKKYSPKHLAIIMDGNGRWANVRNLPRTEGHRAGEYAFMDTLAGAIEAEVNYLSVYAFSTENWKRSTREVSFIMNFAAQVLERNRTTLIDWNVKFSWLGQEQRIPKKILTELKITQEKTKNNTGINLMLCVNYGARTEILDAVEKILKQNELLQHRENKLRQKRITESYFQQYLYSPQTPDVDLMIRTSGEKRLSNFLLWQMAYAELDFVDTLWPDFNRELLWERIELFSHRKRRFGNANENMPENS